MVITRRAPVPPTPNSRTSSAQALPRVAKGKATFDVDGNKTTEQDKAKGKVTKWKKRKSKKTRTRGFVDFLTNICVAALVIYSLSVCPQHQTPQPPLCTALSEYRRLVLEPYIFPYAQQALAHPSIAPYVETVKPHVIHAIAIAKPIALRAQDEFSTRVVPQWDNYVVPQWEKHVVPQYHALIAPQLHKVEAQLQPYRVQAQNEYQRYLSPYLHLAINSLAKWQQQAQPYVILAANKSYDGYLVAKPYARPAWEQFKALVLQLADLAGKYRRQFVDPHVAKIWAEIIELSTGKEAALDPAITPEPRYSFQVEPTKESVTTAAAFTEESTTPVATESSAPAVTPSPMPEVVIEEPIEVPIVVAQVDVYEESAPPATIPVPQPPAVISEETASPIPEVASSSAQPTHTEVAAELPLDITGPSATPSATPSTEDDLELDLDDFYAELGLDESGASIDDSASQVPPPAPEETEAERVAKAAAREQEIFEKRLDITTRHKKWEAQIDTAIVEQRKVLKKALTTWRKLAAVDMKKNEEIRTSVDGLVQHAEKYLKGAEGYLKNLAKEAKNEGEKKALWAKVVDKVDEKFTAKLQETEEVVNQWYGLVLKVELDEVNKATAPVLDIAERSQADIGLDYAWLDDVTYDDWQRYHDLMRKYESFKEEALSMQNGTHASPPANPVLPGIHDLRAEVEDIIVGFETRLRRIKRNGDRVFANVTEEVSEDADEPEVSILPIVPEEEIIQAAVPPVMIGKSQQEVLQMLENAGVDVPRVQATEVPAQSAQEDVDEIVREVEGREEL